MTQQGEQYSKLLIQEQQVRTMAAMERNQLYTLLGQAPSLIHILHGPEHVFDFFHPLGRELVGNRDLTGMKVREALPEYEGQGYFELLDQVYYTGQAYHAKEMRSLLKNQQGELVERYFDFTYHPWRDADGNIAGIFNFAVEVTEQVLARKAVEALAEQLHNERERLELAQQAGKIGTFEWFVQENRIIWTAELEALYGLPAGAFEGKYENWRSRVHPDDIQKAEESLWNAIRGGPPYNVELRVLWPDRSEHWLLAKGMVFFNEQQEAIRVVGVNIDISAEKHVQEALRRSEQRLRVALTNSSVTVYEQDRDMHYTWIYNPSAGYTPEMVVGKTDQELLPYDEATILAEIKGDVLKTGQGRREEIQATGIGGRRYFDLSIEPLFDAQGTISGLVGASIDITGSKELEQRKDEFISIASHELRTPITTVKALTQLLKRKMSEQGLSEHVTSLARIEQNVNRLTKLVSDLLDVSKIQAGRLEYAGEQIDLDALLHDIVETAQHTSATHIISLHGTSHSTITGDSDKLSQVFMNLIGNAIKYSPNADKVDVYLSATEDEARVSVRDYGIGISEEHQDKIFERFYRVVNKQGKSSPGLGMGLYIAHEIVQRHDGILTVSSKEGDGTTFCVTLPIKK